MPFTMSLNRSRRGLSDTHRLPRTPKLLSFVKVLFMILVGVLVLRFQVNRPNVSRIYYTSDLSDTVRGGVKYKCGCTLPAFLQDLQILNPTDGSGPRMNRCYESSRMETVNILMYSNFSGVKDILENILEDSNSSNKSIAVRAVQGFHGTMQGHTLGYNNYAGSDNEFFDRISDVIPQLYLGGFRQKELLVGMEYFVDGTATDFPQSYVMVTFTFRCSNCTVCPLSFVNEILKNISAHATSSQKPWGNCFYWKFGWCGDSRNYYRARCTMYPTAEVPLNFAIQRFLFEFRDMSGITDAGWAAQENYTSLSPSVLYMNFSQVLQGSVQLNFFELQKGSTAWTQLLNLFPALDTNCSDIKEVEVSNGTSLCNIFKSYQKNGYEVKCLDMTDKAQCQHYFQNSSRYQFAYVDDAMNLWRQFNGTGTVSRKDWTSLMCLNYTNMSTLPYLISWTTDPAMENSSFNQFLESKVLLNYWAQKSGVCTKTYRNVLRWYVDNDTSNETAIFMEANCSENPSTDANSRQGNGYCFLTGRYHNLTDKPNEGWHMLENFTNPDDLFVCYNVAKQGFFVWFIITFGILFGWLGTIDLLFKWIMAVTRRLFRRFRRRKQVLTTNATEDVGGNESPAVGSAEHTPTSGETSMDARRDLVGEREIEQPEKTVVNERNSESLEQELATMEDLQDTEEEPNQMLGQENPQNLPNVEELKATGETSNVKGIRQRTKEGKTVQRVASGRRAP